MSVSILFDKLSSSAVGKAGALLILLAVLFSPASLFARFPSPAAAAFGEDDSRAPITWKAEVKMSSKSEGQIILRATLSAGWHLYGTTMPEGGPRPTRFIFPQVEGVEYKGGIVPSAAPVSKQDPMFGCEIKQWEGSVSFTRSFRLSKKAALTLTIPVEVEFMGCNDQTCLPPSSQKFNLIVKH